AELAHHLEEMGHLADALRAAERAVARAPELAIAYFSRAHVRLALCDHAGALADFDEAVRIEPRQAGHFVCRAMARKALGDHRAYLADIKTATVLDPQNFLLRAAYGKLLAGEHDYAGCVQEIEAALSFGGEELREVGRAEMHTFMAASLSRL